MTSAPPVLFDPSRLSGLTKPDIAEVDQYRQRYIQAHTVVVRWVVSLHEAAHIVEHNGDQLSDDEITDHVAPLSAFLKKTQNVARERFAGPLTYGAGPWEWSLIDWAGFDFVGIDHYMNAAKRAEYAREIRALTRRQKPLLVTEFGACTFKGAENLGGMGWCIVDYSGARAMIPTDIERSEQVQADAIGAALDIFEAEGVEGAFVFTFIEPTQTYSVDRRFDLDVASYGIVKAHAPQTETSAGLWEPKLVFHEIARRFARLSARP